MKERIVILGFLSHFPVAGVAWQTIHYLAGFQRLGYDVYYVEAHGCTPSKLMQSETDDGPVRAAAYIQGILRRFDLESKWAYHALYPESRYFGLSEQHVKELYRSAAVIVNLHGSHIPNEELTATNRLVYLETDPVDVQIDLFRQRQETIDYLSPHCAFFTYGENLGNPDCLVPNPKRFKFRATRQPVIMDFWENRGGERGTVFTTIGNWRQPWRQVWFKGEPYRWSKHFEFLKFIDLPQRAKRPFELALSSCNAQDWALLKSKGWRVREALEFSQDLDAYREYICRSRGEFTVAKEQNIRLRSGWFSDRAVTYLAAGRPVITQETGFSNILPTGEGLFRFSTMEEIVAAVEAIDGDYERHQRAASTIARECFSHELVLGRLLNDLGVSIPGHKAGLAVPHEPASGIHNETSGSLRQACPADTGAPEIPGALVLAPTGRWPTRLAEETVRAALALPVPVADCGRPPPERPASVHDEVNSPTASPNPVPRKRASIVVVTHNSLAYTKMCLTTLFGCGWHREDELIIVDNASSDGTPDYLRDVVRLNPFVRILINQENRGFAAANNQGLAIATGDVLILLNNDTLLMPGWRNGLLSWLGNPGIGLVGPVTNRTCNEAQIDAPYRTFGEMQQFARTYTAAHGGRSAELGMLAMFCLAMRREVCERVGALDEQFEVGMFEDDDYARRARAAGYRLVCADDVFVHHFGQGSLGELCITGEYDRVFAANRRRFEQKWGTPWRPHGRRITPEYQSLRERIRKTVRNCLPQGASVAVISKGDDELLQFDGRVGWHYPQGESGCYANVYPAHSEEATAKLEALRARGAGFLLIPKPAFWWLEYYSQFKDHLERQYPLSVRDSETCLVFNLGGSHV
jgi:GT2 family glycosyltransferase